MQIDNGLTTEVWGVDKFHRIFRWDSNAGQWDSVFGLFKQVSAGKNHSILLETAFR